MKDLNLVEILKDCPIGTPLYSDNYGEVSFNGISVIDASSFVVIRTHDDREAFVSSDGRYNINFNGSCTLWPSRDYRTWENFDPNRPRIGEWAIFWDNGRGTAHIDTLEEIGGYFVCQCGDSWDNCTKLSELDNVIKQLS